MTATPVQEIQEEFLTTVRKSQETVVDAIKAWVETVQAITPTLPVPFTPYQGQLPRAEELVAGAYDFAEALLAGQRKFAEDVLKATAPLLPANGKPAPKPAPAK